MKLEIQSGYFRYVQIPVSVLISAFGNYYAHNSTDFRQILYAAQKCRRIDACFFVRETGGSFPILEVCGFRFQQFSGSDDHIFQQISTKSHIEIKFSDADFVFNCE